MFNIMRCFAAIPKIGFVVGVIVLVLWLSLYFVMLSKGLKNKYNLPLKNAQVPYYASIIHFLKTGARTR